MIKMKKHIILVLSALAVLSLSGCGGGASDEYYDDGLTTLFLVDDIGNSYGGIPYICDSMSSWDVTAPNGEFSFYPPEICEFDFTGLNGTTSGNPAIDQIIYIVDYLDEGKNDIPYECSSFIGVDYTYDDGIWDGSFDYAPNDRCAFYL